MSLSCAITSSVLRQPSGGQAGHLGFFPGSPRGSSVRGAVTPARKPCMDRQQGGVSSGTSARIGRKLVEPAIADRLTRRLPLGCLVRFAAGGDDGGGTAVSAL